jgi:Flagellar capping protein
MSISSPGIGSGLDIGALVSQLVAADGASTSNRLNLKEAEYLADISAYGSLKSVLSSFQTSLSGLKDLTDFQQRTATSTDDDVFTAKAFSTADASEYDIEVVQLAKAQKLISKDGYFPTSTEVVGEGTLKFTQDGDTFTIAVGATDTVEDVRDAVNDATGNTGVRASILTVDDGVGGTESKLVFSSTLTGLDNAITVTVDEDGNDQFDDAGDIDGVGLSRLINANLEESVAAVDGKIKVDSQLVSSSTNEFASVINGVTITAKAVGAGEGLTIAEDKASISQKVSSFISSYNQLAGAFKSLTSYNAETQVSGALLGDATLRGIESSIRRQLTSSVTGLNSTFSTLAELGITTDENGELELDQTKLDSVMDTSFDQLGEFFTATNGMASRLDSLIDGYVNTTGIINAKTDGLQASVDGVIEQRAALDRRLVSLESRLLKQFTGLDTLVNSLQNQSSFLTQQLANLPGSYNPNK